MLPMKNVPLSHKKLSRLMKVYNLCIFFLPETQIQLQTHSSQLIFPFIIHFSHFAININSLNVLKLLNQVPIFFAIINIAINKILINTAL